MKDQPWDLNQTWPVGRKWCRFTNTPPTPKILDLSPNLGCKKHQIFNRFFATSALDTACLLNEVLHQHAKMPVSSYNVFPKS